MKKQIDCEISKSILKPDFKILKNGTYVLSKPMSNTVKLGMRLRSYTIVERICECLFRIHAIFDWIRQH